MHHLFCYISVQYTPTFQWCKECKQLSYVSLFSSFCLFYFPFLFVFNFLFFTSAVCWPLIFSSSLSESPLLGHHSSDTARWKFTWNYSHLIQHVSEGCWSNSLVWCHIHSNEKALLLKEEGYFMASQIAALLSSGVSQWLCFSQSL